MKNFVEQIPIIKFRYCYVIKMNLVQIVLSTRTTKISVEIRISADI